MQRGKNVLIVLSFFVINVLKADFVAYQKWINPSTGQELEEYYDIHMTQNIATTAWQQSYLLNYVYGHRDNVLVIVEDSRTYLGADAAGVVFLPSPMLDFEMLCKQYAIPVYNVECRKTHYGFTSYIDLDAKQEIKTYNDGVLYNALYASCKEESIKEEVVWVIVALAWYAKTRKLWMPSLSVLLLLYKSQLKFLAECNFVDAKILHAIATTNKQRIVLAAGAMHIASVNTFLHKSGWISKPYIFSSLMDADNHEKIKVFFDERFSYALLSESIDAHFDKIYQKSVWQYLKAWGNSFFEEHYGSLKDFPLNLESAHQLIQ